MEGTRPPETSRGGGARPAGDVMRDERGRENGRGDHDLATSDGERPAARREGNGAAIAALVTGVLAILVLVLSLGTLFIVALPLGIAAIVLGIVGKRKTGGRGRDSLGHGHVGAKHRGKARAGFWLGLVTTILSILALIGAIALFSGGEGIQDEIRDLAPPQAPQAPEVAPEGD